MAAFQLTREAVNDLRDIIHYTITHWGVKQAQKYDLAIEDFLKFLSGNPLAGKAVPEIEEGVRKFHIHKHFIFYERIDHEAIFHE